MEAERRIAARGFTSNASLEADRATALGEKARDIVDLMSRLEDAGDLREQLAALPGPLLRPASPGSTANPATESARTAPATPPYRLPVVGAVVTGMGELSDSGIRSRGLTIAAQPSAQIVAPAKGHIAFAGPYRGFGRIIIIDHGHGWTTLLTDMAELSVEAGINVAQGEPLGLAGKGRPKITIELRRAGRPIDIVALINAG
jgi:murein hydrolase activator